METSVYKDNLEQMTQQTGLMTQREEREREQLMEEMRRRHLYSDSVDERAERARDEVQEFYREIRKTGINGNTLNNLWIRVQYTFGRNPADIIKVQQQKLERLGRRERRRIFQMEKERENLVENYLQTERDLDEALEYRGMLREAINDIRVELENLQSQRANRPAGKTSLEDQMTVAELREDYYAAQRKERRLVNDKSRVDMVINRYNSQAQAKRANIEQTDFLISSAYVNVAEKIEQPLIQTVDSVDIAKPVIDQVTTSKIAEKQGAEYVTSVATYQSAVNRMFEASRDLVRPNGNSKKTRTPQKVNIESSIREMKEFQEALAADVDELEEKRRTEPFS